tara:strand:- start:82 stop:300 length:219 start_codon:yes stop_codon:yes gene_type:complete
MSKPKFLTIAIRIENAENRGAFVDDIFNRFMEYPGVRDGAAVFAASWTNMFEENLALEAQIEELKAELKALY